MSVSNGYVPNTIVRFNGLGLEESSNQNNGNKNTILIVLNTPIDANFSPCFEELWRRSQKRICADGGANRLYQYNPMYIPDRIRGDLDSVNDSVKTYYETLGVSIEKDPCQDTNDLDKSLQVCLPQITLKDCETNGNDEPIHSPKIFVYGAFGGRFDQEMASFAALYKWAEKFDWKMYLYNEETCAFLIPAGITCEIRLPCYDESTLNDLTSTEQQIVSVGEGPTCGLIPLGCRCDSISTSGLKWDLDGNMPLEFGGLVSSSNRVMKSVVTVDASHPIIFTAELQHIKPIL